MIPKETVDLIIETARIEEVVGDFVSLKRRGANMLGNCPFHTEKTPSFTVSPAKGIYKCFGCGKAGDSVKFVMEHESYSYPEALRYLAEKYRIEIEEEKPTVEQIQKQDEKESLYVLTSFAQKYYSETLFDTEEGKAVGLSYFHERGFNESTIKKFQLGYALNKWDALTEEALRNNFSKEILDKSGLVVVKDKDIDVTSTEKPAQRFYDRFRNRVIFPVHNLTGRVIAFGARILQTDPKSPKYINSPETEIYHKSKSLYGIFFARKAIAQLDECLLVEGYTDVISLHQAGVENVVASSGTSLTQEQIRLIARFTKNVTILYDGDAAGIKASLRGIDLILEEGLNVKIVLFPDGDDPDSFARKTGTVQLKEYIKTNAKDFIGFKTDLLLKDVANDPIKKAGLIKEIVESISKIPDGIIRSMYLRQCAEQMNVSEQILVGEINKLRRSDFKKKESTQLEDALSNVMDIPIDIDQPLVEESVTYHQEKEIIRLMVNYPLHEISVGNPSDKQAEPVKFNLVDFIVQELEQEYEFENAVYKKIFSFISANRGGGFSVSLLTASDDDEIRNICIELLTEKYQLSDEWESKGVFVKKEVSVLNHGVISAVYLLKIKQVMKLKTENQKQIKLFAERGEDIMELMEIQRALESVKNQLTDYLGIVVIK